MFYRKLVRSNRINRACDRKVNHPEVLCHIDRPEYFSLGKSLRSLDVSERKAHR